MQLGGFGGQSKGSLALLILFNKAGITLALKITEFQQLSKQAKPRSLWNSR